MKRILLLILTLILAAVFVGGCTTGSDAPPKKARLTIVTSFYPMYIDALQLTKDVPGVKVICLAKPQVGCLHDYQLSPENVKTLERADLFLVNGAGMESFLGKVKSIRSDLTIIDASRDLALITDSHGHENPHVWVSIPNKIRQIENITGPLTAADPEYAEAYRHNSRRYIEELSAVQDKMVAAVSGATKTSFVAMHESFFYLAKDLGLTVTDVIAPEHGHEPSAKDVEDCIRLMKMTDTKVIFTEPQYADKTAQTIARETGAAIYTLDPVVSGELTSDSATDYLRKMQDNANTLAEALR